MKKQGSSGIIANKEVPAKEANKPLGFFMK